MSFEIMNMFSSRIQKQTVEEIMKCNDHTIRFGLTLSHLDAVKLVETCNMALKSNGRIEFKGSVIHKIIKEFCDSPYISEHNYVETIHDLIEIFYFYKNETLDLVSDDELIKFMKNSFDSKCQGSLELLSGKEAANMARRLRYGCDLNCLENEIHDERDEDGEY
ncbi:hypothetical protein GOQ29_11825 [Clostridium sp. D2Q-14]|uniref:DUF6323 family protein n=1 Tax=Anaeromonas gelatinilytica TaxID=2683194 RepID=UPI00193BD3F9|nr:DUF6323 family protein [Anaeromonas gelatinilytica]MBS4536307.1 hypothetical protein [Anaeromonas gelatinilytica]